MRILPTSASLLLDHDCNLRCKYCFEKHHKNQMSKAVARKSLEYLCFNAIKQKDSMFTVLLFGGEPFLNPDVMEDIFEYGLNLSKKNNIDFAVTIITNATILTEKIEKMLIKYRDPCNISIQLSIDGIKEIHDEYRITRDGKGSFDIIEKNIPRFLDIYKDKANELNVHGCLNKKSLSYLFESYNFFRNVIGFESIWFMPIHTENWDSADVEIYKKQLNLIKHDILEKVKKSNSTSELYKYAPLDRCIKSDARPSYPCGAGRNFVTITAEGDIYPCHHFYFNDPDKTTLVGDIWNGIDDSRRRLFLNYCSEDLCDEECECVHCYRCIAENWCENGSMFSQIKGIYCKLSKVEREMQLELRNEVKSMGLLSDKQSTAKGNNPNNPDCLCDCRGNDGVYDCDGANCDCGNKDEKDEIIAMGLKHIIDRLNGMEKLQELILKKLL